MCLLLGEGGARQSKLVNWYLKEIEAELDSIEEVKTKKVLVEKIIERLVQRVSVEGGIGGYVML